MKEEAKLSNSHWEHHISDPDYPDPPDQSDPYNYMPEFDALWEAIKEWDISRYPACEGVPRMRSGATGNDVMHLLKALEDAGLCVVSKEFLKKHNTSCW